jgi:hypothetical protein
VLKISKGRFLFGGAAVDRDGNRQALPFTRAFGQVTVNFDPPAKPISIEP